MHCGDANAGADGDLDADRTILYYFIFMSMIPPPTINKPYRHVNPLRGCTEVCVCPPALNRVKPVKPGKRAIKNKP